MKCLIFLNFTFCVNELLRFEQMSLKASYVVSIEQHLVDQQYRKAVYVNSMSERFKYSLLPIVASPLMLRRQLRVGLNQQDVTLRVRAIRITSILSY